MGAPHVDITKINVDASFCASNGMTGVGIAAWGHVRLLLQTCIIGLYVAIYICLKLLCI